MINPEELTPDFLMKKKLENIPDAIINATTELIVAGISLSGSVTIKEKDIIKLACKKDDNLTSTKIYDNNWLDIEPIFRLAGWEVSYDKPAYCETYDATFTFSKKK